MRAEIRAVRWPRTAVAWGTLLLLLASAVPAGAEPIDPPDGISGTFGQSREAGGYLCFGARTLRNAVIVRFSDKPWDAPLPMRKKTTRREIVPMRQEFLMSQTDFVVLEQTTIVEIPIRGFK
jgi:hypothetical protein